MSSTNRKAHEINKFEAFLLITCPIGSVNVGKPGVIENLYVLDNSGKAFLSFLQATSALLCSQQLQTSPNNINTSQKWFLGGEVQDLFG